MGEQDMHGLRRSPDLSRRTTAAEKSLRPHPEERRLLAARLEGWPLSRRRLRPSFETAAQEGGLLRMRAELFAACLNAGVLAALCLPSPTLAQAPCLSPFGASPEGLGAAITAAFPKWARAVRAAGVRPG